MGCFPTSYSNTKIFLWSWHLSITGQDYNIKMNGRFLSVLLLVTFMLVLLQPQRCESKGWVRAIKKIACTLSCSTVCSAACATCTPVCGPVCATACGKRKRELRGARFENEVNVPLVILQNSLNVWNRLQDLYIVPKVILQNLRGLPMVSTNITKYMTSTSNVFMPLKYFSFIRYYKIITKMWIQNTKKMLSMLAYLMQTLTIATGLFKVEK